jgi:multicomponent Na+:H+ antiporter subunit B
MKKDSSHLLVIDRVSRLLYPVLLAAALWVLLRGHNEPGGGFIAGLVAVTASVLWAFAHGSQAARRRLPLRSPGVLSGTGVLLAALSGLPGAWTGQPFLTHLWAGPVSTVMLFDLGVALAVWGALAGYVLPLLQTEEAPHR